MLWEVVVGVLGVCFLLFLAAFPKYIPVYSWEICSIPEIGRGIQYRAEILQQVTHIWITWFIVASPCPELPWDFHVPFHSPWSKADIPSLLEPLSKKFSLMYGKKKNVLVTTSIVIFLLPSCVILMRYMILCFYHMGHDLWDLKKSLDM